MFRCLGCMADGSRKEGIGSRRRDTRKQRKRERTSLSVPDRIFPSHRQAETMIVFVPVLVNDFEGAASVFGHGDA